jgi:hypothetical protein
MGLTGMWPRPRRGLEMMEPVFFDCLTDGQCWSLFDAGVLDGSMLPVEVFEWLERLAPDHGCYLFAWPAGVPVPSVLDMLPGMPVEGEEPPKIRERVRSAIEALRVRAHSDIPLAGGRIHVISTHPGPTLREGPYLEAPSRDLNGMSLPELEAYLDEVLRVDDGHAVDAADASG